MPNVGQKINRITQAQFAKVVAWASTSKADLDGKSMKHFQRSARAALGLNVHTKAVKSVTEACGITLVIRARRKRPNRIPKNYHNRVRMLARFVVEQRNWLRDLYVGLGTKLPNGLEYNPERLMLLVQGRSIAGLESDTE